MIVLWFSLRVDLKYSTQAFNQFWINEMAKKVKKIIVLTMYEGDYKLEANVKVYSVGKEKGYSKLRRFFIFYKLLFKSLKEHKVDVVFSHMMPLFVAMAGLVLKIKKIPVFLWYCHGSVTLKLRLALLFSKKVFTCSDQGLNIKTKKKKVIGHGIDLNNFTTSSNIRKTNLIIYVGRISPVKNVHILIEVMNILVHKKKMKEIKLVLIGKPMRMKKDQDYFLKLKMEVKQKNLVDMVIFIGSKSQKELVQYYQRAKIMLHLSDTRSLDKVILEAMACGCIPVSSNDSFQQLFGDKFPHLVISKDPAEVATRIQMLNSMDTEQLSKIRTHFSHEIKNHYTLDRLIRIISHHFIDTDENM
ncbi:MAG: glycosyltransferase family 4 protein [Candidatus Aminicenantes bacterium]|nr:glycosyltransferase family 4 protein [Candidatus Aminicenantes bacterium]